MGSHRSTGKCGIPAFAPAKLVLDLVTPEIHVCEQLAQGCHLKVQRPELETPSSESRAQHPKFHYTNKTRVAWGGGKCPESSEKHAARRRRRPVPRCPSDGPSARAHAKPQKLRSAGAPAPPPPTPACRPGGGGGAPTPTRVQPCTRNITSPPAR